MVKNDVFVHLKPMYLLTIIGCPVCFLVLPANPRCLILCLTHSRCQLTPDGCRTILTILAKPLSFAEGIQL
jgi:hypothetical protein